MLILFFRLTRDDDLVFHLIEKNLGISLDLDFITIGAHTVYPLILFGNPKRDEIMILGKLLFAVGYQQKVIHVLMFA